MPRLGHSCPAGVVNVGREAGYVLTSWAHYPYFQWSQASLAAVHCKRLQDAGSDTRAQARASNFDLAGVHDILHRNSEWATWKRGHGPLSTEQWKSCLAHSQMVPLLYDPDCTGFRQLLSHCVGSRAISSLTRAATYYVQVLCQIVDPQ